MRPNRARDELLLELGEAELASLDLACAEHFGAVISESSDPVLRARAAVSLARVLIPAGEWAAVPGVLERGLADAAGHEDLVLELETVRAGIFSYDAAHVTSVERDRERLTELAASDEPHARALAAILAGTAAAQGLPLAYVRAMRDRALSGGHIFEGGYGLEWGQLTTAFQALDELDGMLAFCDDMTAVGRRTGSTLATLIGGAFRTVTAMRRGDLRSAEADLRVVLEIADQGGMPMYLTQALQIYADLILERPGLADIAAFGRDFEWPDAGGQNITAALGYEGRGRLRVAAGDRAGGLADLRVMAAVYGRLRVHPRWSPWRSMLALVLGDDERDEARALVDEEVALARVDGLPRALGAALRAQGLVRGEVEPLRESVAVLQDSEFRYELARSEVELGAVLRRAGQRAEGREHLSRGFELAVECGAETLLERAREELRAAGSRPRSVVRLGVDALTPTELRVARLAADGATNAEIAQALFVSTKTVETHLSQAYSKLDIAGYGARHRLAEALRRPEPS